MPIPSYPNHRNYEASNLKLQLAFPKPLQHDLGRHQAIC